jgi:protein AroM
MTTTVGLLTIGQSPRPDGLARDVAAVLGGARVLERGALDGLGIDEVEAMRPGPDDYRLVTLLRDRTPVQVDKAALLPRLQAHIDALEQEGADITLLMCTGEFPPFRHAKPLLAPQAALYAVVIALAEDGRVASLTPLPGQVEQARRKWASMGVLDAFVTPADPYAADPCREVAAAAARAAGAVSATGADVAGAAGAGVLFMDCFGYDLAMRDAARSAFPGTVVLARSLAARLAAEVAR